jgi:hypothetical protein
LFAATVNQEPLEEAARGMASVSSSDASYHDECILLFDRAKTLAKDNDAAIINYINGSGYKVSSFIEAYDLVVEFEAEYLKAYRATRN